MRTGYYPERVLADQIYQTRDNRTFCQKNGIRLSGPKLGRLNKSTAKSDKKIEYQDKDMSGARHDEICLGVILVYKITSVILKRFVMY